MRTATNPIQTRRFIGASFSFNPSETGIGESSVSRPHPIRSQRKQKFFGAGGLGQVFHSRRVMDCAKYRLFNRMRVAGEGTNASFSTVLATGVL